MREAILVAMHDSKNVVQVGERPVKEAVATIAPSYRVLFDDVRCIDCYWWGDRGTIEMHIALGDDGDHVVLLYQGAYTAILVPSPYMELKAQTAQPSIEKLAVRRDVFESWEGRQ